MRSMFVVAMIALLPAAVHAQAKKEVTPIPVAKIERKDPIIYKKCITCHSGNVKEGRFDISTYEGAVKGGRRGAAVVPGKSENSNIFKFGTKSEKPFMPPR